MNIFDVSLTLKIFWCVTESYFEFKELISENKIALNVTDKILSTVFSNFAEERAFTLECIISYIASSYFDSDYLSITSNALQKVIQIVLMKRENCVLCNI